jgi:hypothetical protein
MTDPGNESARGLGGREDDYEDSTPSSIAHDKKRRPPAFQEYGATLLNLESIKLMSLAERGLLATLRWYLWLNDTIPDEPALMARLLGLEEHDVRKNLTPAVRSFFRSGHHLGMGDRLECPELLDQMALLMERRRKQSNGGKEGADNRWSHKRNRRHG